MRCSQRRLLFAAATLSATSVVVGCREPARPLPSGELTEAIRHVDAAFPEADRIWSDVEHLQKVPSNFEGTLLNPIRIKEANDHLFVLDKGDASVLRYSPSGTLLSRIGGRVGEGAGELQFLQDIDAGSADVVVLDSRTRLIHRFSMAGRFLNRFDSGVLGLRIVDLDLAVVILDVSRPQPLIVLDTLGRVSRRFGSEISNKNRDPILSDGEIVRRVMVLCICLDTTTGGCGSDWMAGSIRCGSSREWMRVNCLERPTTCDPANGRPASRF